VPIQIIETKKLSEGENLWLKSLSNDNLDFRSLRTILEAGKGHRLREEIGAYMELIMRANPKTFLEVYKMRYPTMEELLTEASLIPEWMERGRAQGMEASRLEIARKMKDAGRLFSEITEFTDLPIETIEQL
jgi:predicted transposase/invertase (TIGR01784 family)